MVIIKSAAEITEMKLANRIVAEVLTDLEKIYQTGLTTAEIDRRARQLFVVWAEPSLSLVIHPFPPASVFPSTKRWCMGFRRIVLSLKKAISSVSIVVLILTVGTAMLLGHL